MRLLRNTALGIVSMAVTSLVAGTCLAGDASTPEPVARAVVALAGETSEPEIGGFRWGSPIATLAASDRVKPSAALSAKCVADIQSADRPDCRAFVATAGSGFAHVFYATARDGLLMVESHSTSFDCARFDDMALPAAGHRAKLANLGWHYLRRERRPEGDAAIVETQLFVRNGIAVELTFLRSNRADGCKMKSYVSKMM